jgi:hypothetical protein
MPNNTPTANPRRQQVIVIHKAMTFVFFFKFRIFVSNL